jgi:hypothetical protein
VYSISDPRIREFLLAGTRTGKLSYTAADGRPLVAPVWFVLEDDAVVFNTGAATGRRYMGADKAEEFGRRNGVPGELVVRLRPVKVLADFNVIG